MMPMIVSAKVAIVTRFSRRSLSSRHRCVGKLSSEEVAMVTHNVTMVEGRV